MTKLKEIEKKLGYEFKNIKLLEEALTHSSYLNENKGVGADNERLEFLGDSVLDTVVSEYLFRKGENLMEGEMSFMRSALVNTQNLSALARELSLEEHMKFSAGQGKAISPSILAGSYEAVVGAMYVDGGFAVAEKFIKTNLISDSEKVLTREPIKDAKTRFQEEAQRVVFITPTYEVKSEEGPDHLKHFTVKVLLGDEVVATGSGGTKKDAEKDAAEKALIKKGWK